MEKSIRLMRPVCTTLETMEGGNLSLQVHPLTEYIRKHFGMKYTQDESYYMLEAGKEAYVYLGLNNVVDPGALVTTLPPGRGRLLRRGTNLFYLYKTLLKAKLIRLLSRLNNQTFKHETHPPNFTSYLLYRFIHQFNGPNPNLVQRYSLYPL